MYVDKDKVYKILDLHKRKARSELEERVREFCQEQEQSEEDTELVDLLLTEFNRN